MVADVYLSAGPFGEDGLDRAAEIAQSVGCTGLEVPASFSFAIGKLRRLGGPPLRVAGMIWRSDEPGDILGALTLAGKLHAEALNIYGALAEDGNAEEAQGVFVDAVRSAIEGTPDDSPTLLLENELADAPGLSASLDAWLGLIQAVGSPRFRGTLDPANFVFAGDEAAIDRIVGVALPFVGHVHAKSLVPFDAGLFAREPFRRRWKGRDEWLAAPPDEGVPDWRRLLPELRAAGYTGAVTVEPFQQKDMIHRAVSFVRSVDEGGT